MGLADTTSISRGRRINWNGRLHCPALIYRFSTSWLTPGMVGTCCAYCSAGTARPYSPSDPIRSAVAAVDETAVVAAVSSATTPRLLTYRGIKNIRIGDGRLPLPTRGDRVADHDLASGRVQPRVEPRACAYTRYKAKGIKREKEKPIRTWRNPSLLYSPLVTFTLGSRNDFTCARRHATRHSEHEWQITGTAGAERNGTRERGKQNTSDRTAAHARRRAILRSYFRMRRTIPRQHKIFYKIFLKYL